MTIQQCTQCEYAFEPCSLKDLTDQDLRILSFVLQTEAKRLERIEEEIEAIGPREAGVTDSVYEVLNAYRAEQALLAEELSYQLSGFLAVGKDPHLQQTLKALIDEEMKTRGLHENVIQ